MTQTVEQKKIAFVLETFETLFVKRDYAAAERFWAEKYIQHSAHIPPGRDGLFNMIKGLSGNARALVISKHGLIQATMDDAGIVLRTQRASRRVIDPDSLSAGHSAGNNASFNRPVNGGGPTLLSGTLP